MRFLSISILGLAFLFSACSTVKKYSAEDTVSESKKVNHFFAKEFAKGLERSPMMYTYMGQKKRYGELNDISHEFFLEGHELTKASLKEMRKFKYDALDEKTKLSYRLYKEKLESQIKGFKYMYHGYYVNQMHGLQSMIPTFLINMHRIDSESDAKAYIQRVKAVNKMFSDLLIGLKAQEEKGVKYPNFVFAKVISDSKNIISGFPFEGKGKAPLYADFKTKLRKLKKLSPVKKKILTRELEIALSTKLGPAY
ncbi:MAG: DUF885 family protein, partial [Bdellovibrionales bacterium]